MLKEFMEKTQLTQKEVANLLNVSQAYISQVLSGQKELSKKCIDKLNQSQNIKTVVTYSVLKDSTLYKIIELIIPDTDYDSLYESLCEYYKS